MNKIEQYPTEWSDPTFSRSGPGRWYVPEVGDDVWYQTDERNGLRYYLAAKVLVTVGSHPGDYPCEFCGQTDGSEIQPCGANDMDSVTRHGCQRPRNPLPVPSSIAHVHLLVMTPGGHGTYLKKDNGVPFEPEKDQDYVGALGLKPGSGTYVELDVPFDEHASPRSWRWPMPVRTSADLAAFVAEVDG